MKSNLVTRFGSGLVALIVAAGMLLSATPVEAAAASRTHLVWRCTTRNHVRHCVRVRVAWHPVARRAKKAVAKPKPKPAPKPVSNQVAPTIAVNSGGVIGQEVALVNRDRAAAGLRPLVETQSLDQIAYSRAQDMATHGYFAHYRPGSSTPAVLELLRGYGVAFNWYGENIIWESGQPSANLASYFNTWWMNSPEHKANILSPHFGHVGIGLYVSGNRVYMVEDFTN
ncbi:MAG TPA: CAP domain-containing protein [Candidatus Dormibacteraeota bacterium]|jgi:uncharacterized protein YkwD